MRCLGMKLDIPTDTNLEVKPPPRRDEASLLGHTIAEATADARYREALGDGATQWVNAEPAEEAVPHER